MKNLLLLSILLIATSAKAQMSIDKVENVSKAIGTVKKLNNQDWTPQMMNVNGLQRIVSENYVLVIDWQFSNIEIGKNTYKFERVGNGLSQILLMEDRSPEIGSIALIFDRDGKIISLKFIAN
jgi:hypothetical protein